ncbi:MAG: AzlD domain-containing protein [Clostridiales bacterium]|nr:AzlD domain-containing protein [Clostridiales bacterium]
MTTFKIICYILVMALTTYFVRMVPLTVFRKDINNRFFKSFLYYIPFAVLGAMTFPAIFNSTGEIYSAIVGLVVAVVLSLFELGLVTVAISSCVAVFIAEFIGHHFF